MQIFGKTRDTLWTLIAAPTLWAAHFLFCYVFVAFRCAPNAEIFRTIGNVRVAVAVATLVALVLIGLILRRSWREWRQRHGTVRHTRDTAEERERFLEFSTLLLAALAFVAVIFDALPAVLIEDCR